MMPRKKRIMIITISIIVSVLIIMGIIAFLYIKTDMFKSNEKLFAKYIVQNFNAMTILEDDKEYQINEILDNNKYNSELTGNIEYVENIGTSNENKNNPINNLKLNINSQTDKQNEIYYKDISISEEENDLVRLEYLNQNQKYGIRLNGIKQFIYFEDDGSELSENLKIGNIKELLNNDGISSIFSDFSDEEKKILRDTYLGILQDSISKDRYSKQSNALITINNQDVNVNAYYITLTVEELNNLYIKILEKLANDEIILSKIDNIENKIKENYEDDNEEKSMRETFSEAINQEIENIKNNNIGNEEVKITVYENGYKTVRTAIEKNTQKITVDMYNNILKIDYLELGNIEKEYIIKIENKSNDTEKNITSELEVLNSNEILLDLQLDILQKIENSNIQKQTKLIIGKQNSKLDLNIDENIQVVNEFENQINLEENNIKYDDLDDRQKNIINEAVTNNFMEQIQNLTSKITIEDLMSILQNIGIANPNAIEISDDRVVTETEKNRFNSNFEFFQTENLTVDNIKDLLQVSSNNFSNMAVMLDTGELKELNIDRLLENSTEASQYNNSISEIIIVIKQNSTNEEKKEKVLKYLEKNSNKKFNVTLDYDENGLVQYIRIKVQKE